MNNESKETNITRRNFLKLLFGSIWGVILSSCNFWKSTPSPTIQKTKTPTPEPTSTTKPTATKEIPTETTTQTEIPTTTAVYCEEGVLDDLNQLVASLADQNILYQNEKGRYPISDGTLYMDVGDWEVEINNQLLEYLQICDLELALLEEIENEHRRFEITNRDGELILNTRSAPLSGPNQGEGVYSIAFTGGIGREFYLAVLIQREWIMIEGSVITFGYMVVNTTKTPSKNGDSTSDISDTSDTSSWSGHSDG